MPIGNYSRGKLEAIIRNVSVAATPEGDITGVTAGNGLTGGGTSGTVTVAVDITSAADGTSIDVSTSDQLLLADVNDSNKVKKITVSQLPSTNVSPGGSDTQIQYNNGSSFGGASSLTYNDSTGYIGIGVTAANASYALTLPNVNSNAGKIQATAYNTYSSIQYKKNVKPIQSPLQLLSKLDGVTFTWKRDQTDDFGFIAEEVAKHLPEIVDWPAGDPYAQSMDYSKIVPLLVESIKSQQKQIDKLQAEVRSLKKI
tara:strand:+ start:2651 stop:3418 length:768 start_codon:yes stop_codon:yes gene_type:complete